MSKEPKGVKRCGTCKHPLLARNGLTACVVCDCMGLWPQQPRGRWKPLITHG